MVDSKHAYDEGYRVAKMAAVNTPFTPDHPNFKAIMQLKKEQNK
jgi:hypothetical protein